MVPAHDFHLLRGHTILTTYTFGTHQAKHLFCSKCGVQTFYIPRSDAESIGKLQITASLYKFSDFFFY